MNAIAPMAEFAGAHDIIAAWCAGMALDPPQYVWEWADENVVLTTEMASEAGRYSSGRTPYLREPLENLSPSSSVSLTALMKGSQIGASQAGLAFLLYVICVSGGPSLVVCPTVAMAELYSKQRLEPLIRACEAASKKILPNKGKASGNTILLKVFAGGVLRLVGAQSVNALKSMPVKVVVFEEPDEFDKDLQGQGDATKIVLRRITTYGRRAKVFANCTPGLLSKSIIYPLFQAGDQRVYRMPCPHGCGHGTVFNKELFRFEKGRPETAHMVCENPECGLPIHEAQHKTAMMDAGVWVPQVKDAPRDMHRSYYLPAFYSPVGWESWEAIATDIEKAEGQYELSKTLWNQTFGLPWSDVTETPDADTIWARRSTSYVSRQIPPGVYFLCAGIDVGIDHIEIGVWGFGKKGRRWLIEHVRLRGRYTDPELWARAKAFLLRRYLHPSGAVLTIRKAGVDRGKWPDVVMPWVQRQDPDWIVAVRGNEKSDAQILKESVWKFKSPDGSWSSDEGVKYWTLGVGLLKLELMGHLNLARGAPGEETPPGYIELPLDVDLSYVEQLTSEEYVDVKSKRGRPTKAWKPIGGLRHEALDTANYARAMAEVVGWSAWSDVEYAREERAMARAAEENRLAMNRLERERHAAGDTRRVTVEDVVMNIVKPLIEGGVEEAEPMGASVPRVIPARVEPDAAPSKPKIEPAEILEKAEDDPWSGMASSWGGWKEDEGAAKGAGIVGCTPNADPLPVPALTQTAWDRDGDL